MDMNLKKQGLLGLLLSLSLLFSGCNSNSPRESINYAPVNSSTMNEDGEPLSEEELQAAILARAEAIKKDCRERGGKSCEVMALEALSDYELKGDFADLKSAIVLATKACGSDRRYCLIKGDLFFRAYKDGLNIETWLPGRYIRDELTNAYTMATQSGDIAIAGDAFYKLGLVNTEFNNSALAQKNFDLGCKIGGANNCISGAEQLTKLGKSDSSLDAYKKACEFNNSSACLRLGDRLYELKKYKEGNDAYSKACDLKDGSACQALAERMVKAKNFSEAASAYQRSCDLGNMDSCVTLARSKVRSGNLDKALELFNKACDANNNVACQFVGDYHIFRSQSAQAQSPLGKACSAQNAQACYELGLNSGKSGQQYLVQACNLDHKLACTALIASYGTVSPEATNAYGKSCDSGNKDSCMQLANSAMQQNDNATANRALTQACKLNSPVGCEQLAMSDFSQGYYDAGMKNSIKACNLKSGTSCMQVAFAYTQGVGVKKNLNQASAYYNKACKLGLKDACYIVNGK